MIGSPLIFLATLVGQTAASKDSGEKKPAVKAEAKGDLSKVKAEAEYNVLKAKTPLNAAARWKLALWCEERGLKDLAHVHLGEVVMLDPSRDAAWRKLGFKKQGDHWATEAQIAEELEQKKADKRWAAVLKKVHKDIHGGNGKAKRLAAEGELGKIADPRAILPVYREFGGGDETDQWILIDFLARIDKPVSSKVAALVAVYGKSKAIRRGATDLLRGRASDDFLDVLVGLMADEYKFEVKPVGGPGSPGVLFVEGEKFNVSRFYAPPAAPNMVPQPGDIITYNQYGDPIINRPVGEGNYHEGVAHRVKGSKTLASQKESFDREYAQFSPTQLAMEAERGAIAAGRQLEADVDMIKTINNDRKAFSEVVMAAAREATGKDAKTPKEWREKLPGRGFSKQPPGEKPTYPELVALEYNPAFGPTGFTVQNLVRTKVYVDT